MAHSKLLNEDLILKHISQKQSLTISNKTTLKWYIKLQYRKQNKHWHIVHELLLFENTI